MTDKVVVITGASSGIGEAVALRLAKKHYEIVLTSRNKKALQAVAKQCEALGARTLVVETDITQAAELDALLQRSLEHFGAVDAWINNAGVIFYGRFLDVSPDEFRRVVETNLFGTVYGSRVALTHFRQQNYGTLINVSSGFGAVPAPFVSGYVTSKFAVRGLTAALVQELSADKCTSIHVCGVLPATVDTPVYQHSGNRMERPPRAMPPVYSANKAARKIARLVDHPKTEVVIGSVIRFGIIGYALAPALFLRAFARYVRRFNYLTKPAQPRHGNTFEPKADGSISGGWRRTHKVQEEEL